MHEKNSSSHCRPISLAFNKFHLCLNRVDILKAFVPNFKFRESPNPFRTKFSSTFLNFNYRCCLLLGDIDFLCKISNTEKFDISTREKCNYIFLALCIPFSLILFP